MDKNIKKNKIVFAFAYRRINKEKHMKVAFVVNDIFCLGGVERSVITLCNLFISKGFEVTVFSCLSTAKDSKQPYFKLSKNVKIIEPLLSVSETFFYKKFYKHKTWLYIKNLSFIKEYLKQFPVDFLISASY